MNSQPPFILPYAANNYEMTQLIGTGSFSWVFKARKLTTKEILAVKVIPKHLLSAQGDRERLQREIDSMAFIRHDKIVALYDFFSDHMNFYLVIDFCQGGTLYEFIQKGNVKHENHAATIFQQIVTAVGYCHENGIAHRDLKLQNILMTNGLMLKVSDFGLCGFVTDDGKMNTFCGSPCYTAPETLSQVEYDGKLSDMWSLGVILYEIVVGKHPWNVSNTSAMIKQIMSGNYTIPSSVSPACADLIRSLLKVRPMERPSCEAILQHRWLRLSQARKQGVRDSFNSFPPLPNASMSTITKSIDRSCAEKDHGIVSPFLDLPGSPIKLSQTLQPIKRSPGRSSSVSKHTSPMKSSNLLPKSIPELSGSQRSILRQSGTLVLK